MRLVVLGLALITCIVTSGSSQGALLPLRNTDLTVTVPGASPWTGTFTSAPFTPGPITSFTPVVMTSTPSTYGTIFGTTAGVQNGWLSNDANGLANTPVGTYTFSQTFTAAANDFVNIKFEMLHDNNAKVLLNGVELYSSPDSVGYQLPPDYVEFYSAAQVGLNTLSFVVVNEAAQGVNPVGLSVLFDAQRTFIENNPVPEPATMGMWALGLGAFGLIRRRRK